MTFPGGCHILATCTTRYIRANPDPSPLIRYCGAVRSCRFAIEPMDPGGLGVGNVKNLWEPFFLASQLGLTMGFTSVVLVLGGLLLGRWLDRSWGTHPVATLTLLFAGAVASSLNMYRLARGALQGLAMSSASGETPAILHWRGVGQAFLLALMTTLLVSGPALAGLWLGLWMDRILETRGALTIALGTMGILAGAVGMYLVARRSTRHVSDTANRSS